MLFLVPYTRCKILFGEKLFVCSRLGVTDNVTFSCNNLSTYKVTYQPIWRQNSINPKDRVTKANQLNVEHPDWKDKRFFHCGTHADFFNSAIKHARTTALSHPPVLGITGGLLRQFFRGFVLKPLASIKFEPSADTSLPVLLTYNFDECECYWVLPGSRDRQEQQCNSLSLGKGEQGTLRHTLSISSMGHCWQG